MVVIPEKSILVMHLQTKGLALCKLSFWSRADSLLISAYRASASSNPLNQMPLAPSASFRVTVTGVSS